MPPPTDAGAIGKQGYGGIAKETVYGTFVPSTSFFLLESHTVEESKGWFTPEAAMGGLSDSVRLEGMNRYRGPVVNPAVNLDDPFLGLLLKDLLGSEAYTLLESGCGQHVFTPQAATGLIGVSMELSNDKTITSNVLKVSGGHALDLEFTGDFGKPSLRATANMHFSQGDTGATPQSPTYQTATRYAMIHTGTLKIETVATKIRALNLKIARAVDADRQVWGSKYDAEPLFGKFTPSGSITVAMPDHTEITRQRAGTVLSLEVDLTGPLIGASTTRLKFNLEVVYEKAWPTLKGMGEQLLEIPFSGLHGTLSSLVSVTLVNSTVAAY
jgi:hypothetical protein